MDSTTLLDLLETSQSNKELRINELLDAVSPAALFGRRASTTSGLTWGYYGGRVGSTLVPNDDVALTDDATNYIVVDRETGLTVTVLTATTQWNDGAEYRRLYKVVTEDGAVTSYEDHRESGGGSSGAGGSGLPIEWQVACSDIVSALTTGAAKASFRAPCAVQLTEVRASVHDDSSSGPVTIDINVNNTSILSTKLTIDSGEESSLTAAQPVFATDGEFIDDDDKITIDIDAAGTGAKGLVVTFKGARA